MNKAKSDKRLEVRLTVEQMTKLEIISKRLGLSKSATIKYLITTAERGYTTTSPLEINNQ